MTLILDAGSPFDLADGRAYAAWRERRLAEAPRAVGDLVVAVADIARPTAAERAALLDRVRRCNMAVFAEEPRGGRDGIAGRNDRARLKEFAKAFGLRSLDTNALADDDGVTPLAVHRDGVRARYIPYTERPIAWHTDGYYNPPARTVRALLLYCASPAAEGGANRVADAERLYIALRDEDPALVAALMRPDAMTIPANQEEGLERPATPGPVFAVEGGRLCMRYTARGRNVDWADDPMVRKAAAAIRRLLDTPSDWVFEHRLQAGQGLLSNNVLHTREPFRDDPAAPRLLYRARYHDRMETM
jgi:alpha-ketoglutarate-dependent taurine dioxygenase